MGGNNFLYGDTKQRFLSVAICFISIGGDCFYEEKPAALANCPKLHHRLLQVEKNKCVGVSLMETNRALFPFFHRRLDTIKGLTDLVWEVK